jgi:hypothetical protein
MRTDLEVPKPQTNSRHMFAISQRDAPEFCIYLSPYGGRGECRVPTAPAASCALCIGRTHTSNNEYTGIARHSRTQWFYGLCRALPGDRAVLPPSLAESAACPRPVGPTSHSANLTPASGRQDHTILPSANNISRQRAVDRSQVFRPALRSRRAQNAAASIASLPAFVTMANAPLWGGTRKVLDVIWGEWEQKYFSEKQK